MDVQLKELIETIKKDGVESAEEESRQIIEAAEKKAEEIIAAANKEGNALKNEAEQEAKKFENSSREALKQAGRDLILQLEQEIKSIFDKLISENVSKSMDSTVLQNAIVGLVKSWGEKQSSQLEILLNPKDLEAVEDVLKKQLANELAAGMEIKSLSSVKGGFRVSEKDGAAYYDFSSEGIAEVISEYMNPRLGQIIKESAQSK